MAKTLLKTMIALVAGMVLSMGQAVAGQFTVTVKNLTSGMYFTPLLITAHDGDTRLFETGTPASLGLQAVAEGGVTSGLVEILGGLDQDTVVVAAPEGGPLSPGDIVSDIPFDTLRTRHRYLSLVAMLLPTNDGFVGLDSLRIPRYPGTYKYYLLGYDAGTEANDELLTGGGAPNEPGIPGAPGGDGGKNGTGVTLVDTNTMVHIHRGVIGDTDPEGGISDLDSTIHGWLNPVEEVIIEVQPRHRYDQYDDDDDDNK